jgi:hypothetical protein
MVNSNFTEAKARLAEMAAKTEGTNAAGRSAPRHRMALGQDGNQGESRLIKVNQTKSTFHFLKSVRDDKNLDYIHRQPQPDPA